MLIKTKITIAIAVFFVGLFLFLLIFNSGFRTWFKHSMEGNDNKASGIRIISFIMTGLVVFLVFQSTVRQRSVNEWMFEGLLLFIAAVWGIMYVPKTVSAAKNNDTIITTEKTTTIEPSTKENEENTQ